MVRTCSLFMARRRMLRSGQKTFLSNLVLSAELFFVISSAESITRSQTYPAGETRPGILRYLQGSAEPYLIRMPFTSNVHRFSNCMDGPWFKMMWSGRVSCLFSSLKDLLMRQCRRNDSSIFYRCTATFVGLNLEIIFCYYTPRLWSSQPKFGWWRMNFGYGKECYRFVMADGRTDGSQL